MRHTCGIHALLEAPPKMALELAPSTGVDPHLDPDREVVILEILNATNLGRTQDPVLPIRVGAGSLGGGSEGFHGLVDVGVVGQRNLDNDALDSCVSFAT